LKRAKKAEGKADGVTKAPNNSLRATFQADLEKAKKAVKNAKGTMTTAASQMFAFYASFFLSK
jgi:hypothetical protein